MKKKIVALLVAAMALCLCVVALAGCGSKDETAPFEGKILMGFDIDGYEPYGYMDDNGEYVGFDIDLATEVCARNGWDLELCPVAWDSIQAEMDSGNINCVWNGLTRTDEREDAFALTEDYMYNAQVVVVKADSDYADLAALNGKKIVTQSGAPAYDLLAEEYAEDINIDDVELVAGYTTAFMEIESGTADAVACDFSVANAQMAAKPDTYKILTFLNEEAYCVAFNKAYTDVAETVSNTLREMYADGTVETICAKWADAGVNYEDWKLV